MKTITRNIESLKDRKIVIIGAGIHGCFLASYLSKYNFKIYLLDKNNSICKGTSASTHNRANRGYHYPRSQLTMLECMQSYDFFKKNYRNFLEEIDSYYCIEKTSKVNFKKYQDIFKKSKLYYKKINKNTFIKPNLIEGIIKAQEGCFNHYKIIKFLSKQLNRNNIHKKFNFELKDVQLDDSNIVFKSKNKKLKLNNLSCIVNTTYDNSNAILKLFNIKSFKKYLYQNTEIPVVFSKKKFPGITVMDGPYATIMPYAGKKNHYLLYDVENSIINVSKINKINKKKNNITNYKKIILKLKKYINFVDEFKYKHSLYGSRPIPVNSKGDDRSTKIQINKINDLKIFSVFEGKYISAPYEMLKLAKKIVKLNEKK